MYVINKKGKFCKPNEIGELIHRGGCLSKGYWKNKKATDLRFREISAFPGEKVLFTGDTLFSLGCGRVFEGTYEQMFQSLNKLKNLPADTKIYCGHEYTYKNLEFCIKFNPNNGLLKKKKDTVELSLRNKKPTIPSTIEEETQTNIFFKLNDPDVKKAINLENSSDIEIFTKLRDLKDNF